MVNRSSADLSCQLLFLSFSSFVSALLVPLKADAFLKAFLCSTLSSASAAAAVAVAASDCWWLLVGVGGCWRWL